MSDLPASTEQAPINFDHALKAALGNAKLLSKVVGLLLKQMDVDLPAIRAGVAARDSPALANSSHRLKGSLGAIAANPAYLCCTALNQSARSVVIASYEPELALLEHELARLRPCLQAWLIEQTK